MHMAATVDEIHDRKLIVRVPPRLPLSQTPTRIQFLPRLSKMLKARIYCKRDDMTGFGYGGNKIRKLEYLLSDARQRGYDCLLTWGSNQSNWCCMVSVAGAVLGMDVHLVLEGPVPAAPTGNVRLNRIVGATMRHVDTSDDEVIEAAVSEVEQSLIATGRRPYRMVVGGSNGLGSIGYANAFFEILEFEQASGVTFSKIIHATGSGGTQAGLLAGAVLSGSPREIIGMAVSRSSSEQQRKVRGILSQMLHADALEQARIVVEDGFVGGGYRVRTRACTEAIELFARVEGIFLDEVYTGKAAAGLLEYARSGRFERDEPILFVHTGGTAQLFE